MVTTGLPFPQQNGKASLACSDTPLQASDSSGVIGGDEGNGNHHRIKRQQEDADDPGDARAASVRDTPK